MHGVFTTGQWNRGDDMYSVFTAGQWHRGDGVTCMVFLLQASGAKEMI